MPLLQVADDPHHHPRLHPLLQDADAGVVGDVPVDEELALRPAEEGGEALSRVDRAHDQQRRVPGVLLPVEVGVEELLRLLDERPLPGGDPEAAAAPEIGPREVVGEDVELLAVDDHDLPVIAQEVVVAPGDGRSDLQ